MRRPSGVRRPSFCRDAGRRYRPIRKQGRGELSSPDLRLDQRTLQLWWGSGAHVCQAGWISLAAESRATPTRPPMKGLFAYAVFLLRACLCHNLINITGGERDDISALSTQRQPAPPHPKKMCTSSSNQDFPCTATHVETHSYSAVWGFTQKIWWQTKCDNNTVIGCQMFKTSALFCLETPSAKWVENSFRSN